MSPIIGWRIQVRPQFCDFDLDSSTFIDVAIADRDAAVAAVRNREDAEWGEHVFAVRPLDRDVEGEATARVIPLTEDLRRSRRNAVKQSTG